MFLRSLCLGVAGLLLMFCFEKTASAAQPYIHVLVMWRYADSTREYIAKDAKVVLTNTTRNQRFTGRTGNDGKIYFDQVPLGNYTIEVTHPKGSGRATTSVPAIPTGRNITIVIRSTLHSP